MEFYLDRLKNPNENIEDVLRSGSSQKNNVFKQDMGSTPYTAATKKRERVGTKATSSTSLSQSSADADNDGDEDDELNLTEGSSQPGTPVKIVSSSHLRAAASNSRKLPSFNKSKNAMPTTRNARTGSAHSSLSTAASSKPRTRTSSQSARKSVAEHTTVPKPRPAYTHIPTGDIDATPKPKKSSRQAQLTVNLETDATPKASKKGGTSNGIRGKYDSMDTTLVPQPFPLASKASRGKAEGGGGSSKMEVAAKGPQPFPLLASKQANTQGKGKWKEDHEYGDQSDLEMADKRKIRDGPQAFPLSKKSINLHNGVSSHVGKKRSSSSEVSDPKDHEAKKAKMVPKPHPMMNEFMEKSSQPKPPSSSSVASSSKCTIDDGQEEEREARRRRIEAALALAEAEGDKSILADEYRDPSSLCPYCDQQFPPNPSPLLENLLKRARALSSPDPRPNNRLGLKASILVYVDVCQRHAFETEQLPLARSKGWPTVIEFSRIPDRMARFKDRLVLIVKKEAQSVFWNELSAEIEQEGSRKVMGIAGQYVAFDKSQPGYYGEQGSLIISQTLYTLFPLVNFDAGIIAPLSPAEFIQRVLVPEAAVNLIMEDMNIRKSAAIETLRESSRYGVSMFPSLDMGGAEETIVRERALARRKEIEAEEKMEGELARRKRIDNSKAATSKAKGRGRLKSGRTKNDEEVTDIDDDVSGSEASWASRKSSDRRARRRKVGNSDIEMVDLTSPPARSQNLKPRLLKRNGAQSSSFLSGVDGELDPSRKSARRPRPAYTSDASNGHMSDSEMDSIGAATSKTPRPGPLMKVSKGGQKLATIKINPIKSSLCPLEMARAKQLGNSTSSDAKRLSEKPSSKDSEGWVTNLLTQDSSDSDEIAETSDGEYGSTSKPFGSKPPTEGPKDDSWLLSSSQEV